VAGLEKEGGGADFVPIIEDEIGGRSRCTEEDMSGDSAVELSSKMSVVKLEA